MKALLCTLWPVPSLIGESIRRYVAFHPRYQVLSNDSDHLLRVGKGSKIFGVGEAGASQ